MKKLDDKNKGFTLIELLAVIIIISVIAVVAVPKVLDVIENSKRQTSIESGQLYARAVNQNMTFSDLDSSKYKSFFKSGQSVYSVNELSSVTVKNKPQSGSVTINDKRVVGANLCINEYNVIYNDGKWSAKKSDKCGTTSTIDPSKLPKYEENEVVYFDPINYKLCDNESDTCYAWLVLHGNTDEGKYELVYKNTGVYDYGKALENNNGSADGALVNYINTITETWSDKIPKPEAKYNINSTFDFTGLKARIMNTVELSENNNALLNGLNICPSSTYMPCLIMGENTFYYLMQNSMQSTFGFSESGTPFYITPVIRVDLTTVENIKDYKVELPIAFDWENWDSFNTYELSFFGLTNMAKRFMDTVKASGYDAMLYSSKTYLENIWMSVDYPVWLAHYTKNTNYAGDYSYWQICSNGRVDGINGDVDIDIRYID